jgi:hypothetical protein
MPRLVTDLFDHEDHVNLVPLPSAGRTTAPHPVPACASPRFS